jgi:hypothetical protein
MQGLPGTSYNPRNKSAGFETPFMPYKVQTNYKFISYFFYIEVLNVGTAQPLHPLRMGCPAN